MTNRARLACAGVAAAVLAVAVYGQLGKHHAAQTEQEWPDLSLHFDRAKLQDGDLVFRRGRDAIADAVMRHSNGARYSHVGVLVMRGMKPYVIHAVPDEGDTPRGVIEEPFEVFGEPEAAAELGIYRIDGLSDADREVIRTYLESQLGKPFDFELRASDESAHYCTELVASALNAAGVLSASQVRAIESGLMPEPVIPPEALLEPSRVTAVRATGA